MPSHEAVFEVNAPAPDLWRFIRDFQALCSCIPGVERIAPVDERTVELTVREKVGVVPMILELTARIESETPPRGLRAVARAEHLTMQIEVGLQEAGARTRLRALFQVEGEGPMKAVVDRLFARRARERAEQFARTLEARFGAGPAVPAAPTPGFLARLLAWLAGLLRRGRDRPL